MSGTHFPVLVNEIVALAEGASRFVDCTLGDGGHSARFLAMGGDLLAIDRDADAIARAKSLLGTSGITYLNSNFADPGAWQAMRDFRPDFVLLDLGLSSYQIDTDSRGFSFRRGVQLDMRMDRSTGPTAAELLNKLEVERLHQIFADYADEPKARLLAAQIARRRDSAPFETSNDLVNAVRGALGPRSGPADFARIFQAVRIEVNGEMDALETTLPVVLDALVSSGIVAVICYHSVEDRIVKHLFRDWERKCVCPPRLPVCSCRGRSLGERLTRKPMLPSEQEIADNQRARSARLRAFRKSSET